MAENKITKLKILIDKHFDNITNISKHTPNVDNDKLLLLDKEINIEIKPEQKTEIELEDMMHTLIFNILEMLNNINKEYKKNMELKNKDIFSTSIFEKIHSFYSKIKSKTAIKDDYININKIINDLHKQLWNLNSDHNIINYLETLFNIGEISFWLLKLKALFIISNPFIIEIIKTQNFIDNCNYYCKDSYKKFIDELQNKDLINYYYNEINKRNIINDFSIYIIKLIDKCIKDINCYKMLTIIAHSDNIERCELNQKFDKLKEYF